MRPTIRSYLLSSFISQAERKLALRVQARTHDYLLLFLRIGQPGLFTNLCGCDMLGIRWGMQWKWGDLAFFQERLVCRRSKKSYVCDFAGNV
jgi:hypothetical protein